MWYVHGFCVTGDGISELARLVVVVVGRLVLLYFNLRLALQPPLLVNHFAISFLYWFSVIQNLLTPECSISAYSPCAVSSSWPYGRYST